MHGKIQKGLVPVNKKTEFRIPRKRVPVAMKKALIKQLIL